MQALVAILSIGLLIFSLQQRAPAPIFSTDRPRAENTPKVKNIRGVVVDRQGTPIEGARVFVRDTKTNVTRTLITDGKGAYGVNGLPPNIDYEVTAEFNGKASPEKKTLTALLDRTDNILNFQLDAVAAPAAAAAKGPEFASYDLVQLKASFDIPSGMPAPIPAVLLLHGFGEDRSVWDGFKKQLLARGWAVMALDLRGHGASMMKNNRSIRALPEWRTSAHEFTQDIDPALDWLKKQPRLETRKIAVIGFDIGANLALIASGAFPEVRSAIAVKPNLDESLSMAGSGQDFRPRSTLVIVPDAAEADRIKPFVKAPFRAQTLNASGGTAQWFENKQLVDAALQWLKETY